jgi:aminoglycoside phosphotransferase (APT) family kinase protein
VTNVPSHILADLTEWALAYVGPLASVVSVAPMPGNSGLSFGFDIRVGEDSPAIARSFVVRFAPPGVRRSGNTDVLRQVPLLAALRTNGIPVPQVRWFTNDPAWFGTDAIIQDRLDAKPLHMWDPALSIPVDDTDVGALVDRATDVLAAIHNVPWTESLRDWESARPILDELAMWRSVLRRSNAPAWISVGERLFAVLADAAVDDANALVGVLHGDYHLNNILYDPALSVAAVIDWEISGIGHQLVDLAWFAMFTDPTCWHESHSARMRVVAPQERLVSRYEAAIGLQINDFEWYRALACFRFGAIATYNVNLHRSGRRVDAFWEHMALSIETVFSRGLDFASWSGPR